MFIYYLFYSLHCLPLEGKLCPQSFIEDKVYVWFLACNVIPRSCVSNSDTWQNATIWVTNSQEKMSHRVQCGPFKIYLHWNYLLIALLDRTSCFLLSLLILCCFFSEIITPLFMFILTMSLVKMIFIIWESIRSFYCLIFIESGCFFQDLL